MTPDELDAIRARFTPRAPTARQLQGHRIASEESPLGCLGCVVCNPPPPQPLDAETALALLARIAELEAARDRWRAVVTGCDCDLAACQCESGLCHGDGPCRRTPQADPVVVDYLGPSLLCEDCHDHYHKHSYAPARTRRGKGRS